MVLGLPVAVRGTQLGYVLNHSNWALTNAGFADFTKLSAAVFPNNFKNSACVDYTCTSFDCFSIDVRANSERSTKVFSSHSLRRLSNVAQLGAGCGWAFQGPATGKPKRWAPSLAWILLRLSYTPQR